MAAVMVVSAFSGVPVSAVRTVDDIKAEQEALSEKQEELKSEISRLESEAATSLEYQKKLEEEITLVQEQITTTSENIKELDASIVELEKKVKVSEEKYRDVFEQLKDRIKAIYKTGNVGTLEILFNSESLKDYSIRAELMKNMTRHDKELMETINTQLKETEAEREELKKQKTVVGDLKKSLESKNEELEGLEAKNEETIEKLKENKVLTEQTLEESYGYGDDLANEMAAIIASMSKPKPTPAPTPTPEPNPADPEEPTEPENPTDPENPEPTPTPEPDPAPDPGDDYINFQWPCQGYSYISAGWMGYPGHKGMDLAANYGTPITAAASGTVIMANSTDDWGYSWGYYVSIFHNSTYSTLYAHCSSLAVSNGQYVEAGQVIAYVGSTGNSTGNHLHFEVYENGTRVDPGQFF